MPFAVYALALAAFAIGTAEFVISGILPPLAADLEVTIPTAGLLVTAYAIGIALGGPILGLLTARFSQKAVLIGVMAVFALAQILCAFAPDYGMLLGARLLSSAAHGAFFAAGNIVVANAVPPERRGAAFSLFIGGITVANLLGVPGGTAVGVAFGWRATFLTVAVLGALAALVLLLRLPPARPTDAPHASFREQLAQLRHHQVWLSYLTITFVMAGQLAFGTFQVPIMLNVTGLAPGIVPIYLLIGGLGSVLGVWLGGVGADRKPMPFLLAVLLLQAFFYFTMLFAMHDMVWMTANLLITSVVGFAFSSTLQSRIMGSAAKAPNFASSLVATAFNVGIAAGSFIGAQLLNAGVSYADIPAVGIVFSLLAALSAGSSWYLERRETTLVAAGLSAPR